MWEFSLNLQEGNLDLANNIFTSLKAVSSVTGGVVTSHQENGYISILIGVDENRREEMEKLLSRSITKVICTYYKSAFLDKYLFLPQHDKIGTVAFKKALLNFDRETDHYIIQKNLTFDQDLYLDSFYLFKLRSLKSKWTELVGLANENRDYLLSNESFIDLLKFLVDNLDILEEEVNVIEEKDGFKIFLDSSDGYDCQYENAVFNEEGLVSSIIDLSPQKINIYCNNENHATELLERIYVERIHIKKTAGSVANINKR